ncbi:class I SAM-dependent methyltransferase [Bradyrhizobium sp.]|uniref:class I SAM-dependent methyltransferase n=1 Tax=Bradyrhizobium sp. TaxID=376 RepID=UPI001EC94B3B|nr:class I SAM-dependent methyltransferase [Bradyrhizobium sp.]MBV8918874.1 class I SAM-dependent methyltransferase [Bradyrhizobium sp.]MBV9985144.1 class I SAM-dependent methyltransferase [Bradyrhizobium sp.]
MQPNPLRHRDGSAGDANYGVIGERYAHFRRPDPRIAGLIETALGAAQAVLNVGAGAGSCEPVDRTVIAVEPSQSMRSQRPPHLPTAIDAVAEHLPFGDASFDASMSTFSVHQWKNLSAGLREMRRVTRGPVVIMTCEPTELDRFWLQDYCPEVIGVEAGRYPAVERIAGELGGRSEILPVPIPLDCSDGFNEAYYGRPEMLLDPQARLACSAWSFVGDDVVQRFERTLGHDLSSGRWNERYGPLRTQAFFEGALKLIVGRT